MAEKVDADFNVCHFSIAYDYEKAAKAAEQHGDDDWATTLRTGYVI